MAESGAGRGQRIGEHDLGRTHTPVPTDVAVGLGAGGAVTSPLHTDNLFITVGGLIALLYFAPESSRQTVLRASPSPQLQPPNTEVV